MASIMLITPISMLSGFPLDSSKITNQTVMFFHILFSISAIQHPKLDQVLAMMRPFPSTGWPGRQLESCLKNVEREEMKV